MKTLLSLLLLLSASPVLAQFSRSALDFNFELSSYAGRYDTTRNDLVTVGAATTDSMTAKITTADSVLGFSDGLATDYGKFYTSSLGRGLLQISTSIDTAAHLFRRIFVREIDTLDNLPIMDAIVIQTRSITLSDVPFQMTTPGVISLQLTGADLAAHLQQGYAEHIDHYFRTTVTPTYSLDFVASADSVANASLSVSITIPQASVGIDHDPAISVWPNPVASVLHVDNLEPAERVTVYDALGREVASANGPSALVDLSSMAAGAYFVRIGESDLRPIVVGNH